MTTDWNLVRKLKLLGFEENEARVYLASLELGPATMWQIHQESFIKRTTCYQIFEKFIERGIGAKTQQPKHTIYSVVTPENLITSLEFKKSQFADSLPMFDGLLSKSSSKPEVAFYNGVEGVRQVLYQSLTGRENSEFLLFATPKVWLENPEENKAYIKERIKKNIKLRLIFPDEKENYSLLKSDKKELRETRFLPKESYNPLVETQIFENRVVYIAYTAREPFATVIENVAIARAEIEKFEMLWRDAKTRN